MKNRFWHNLLVLFFGFYVCFANASPINALQLSYAADQDGFLKETVKYRQWLALPTTERFDPYLFEEVLLSQNETLSNMRSLSLQKRNEEGVKADIDAEIAKVKDDMTEASWDGVGTERLSTHHFNNKLKHLREQMDQTKEVIRYLNALLAIQKEKSVLYDHWVEDLRPLRKMMHMKEQFKIGLGSLKETNKDLEDWQSVLVKRFQGKKKSDNKNTEQLQFDLYQSQEMTHYLEVKKSLILIENALMRFDYSLYDVRSIPKIRDADSKIHELKEKIQLVYGIIENRLDVLEKTLVFMRDRYQKRVLSEGGYREYQHFIESQKEQYHDLAKAKDKLQNHFDLTEKNARKLLHMQLSHRQIFPITDLKVWQKLTHDMTIIPFLTVEGFRHSLHAVFDSFLTKTGLEKCIIFGLLLSFCIFWYVLYKALLYVKSIFLATSNIRQNIFCAGFEMLYRIRKDLLIYGFIYILFLLLNIPGRIINVYENLGLIWFVARLSLLFFRIALYENTENNAGLDVKLYKRLKISILFSVFTLFALESAYVFSMSFHLLDIFQRLFMLTLLVLAIILFKERKILLQVISAYVDERRSYLRQILVTLVRVFTLLLFVNSLLGILGYLNLVSTMSFYEGLFLLVLVLYQFADTALKSVFRIISQIMIRHLQDGWLLMESILKPLDAIMRIVLIFLAFLCLMYVLGWNQLSLIKAQLDAIFSFCIITIGHFDLSVGYCIKAIFLFYLIFWIAKWSREFSYRWLYKNTSDMSLRNSLAVFSQYGIVLLSIYIALEVLNVQMSSIKFILGGLAVGLGFGLRDLANNFVSGILLLIERPLRIGDFVRVGEYEGQVRQIGMRSILINSWDRMSVYVPNAEVFSKSFTNWTREDSIIRTVVTINVHRDDDPAFVRTVILDTLDKLPDIANDPKPQVYLKNINETLVEIEVRYYINLLDGFSRPAMRSQVLLALCEVFKENNIKAPIPKMEISVDK